MKIVGKITDWQLRTCRPDKRTWMRYNPGTDEIEILEEFLEDVPLHQARLERDAYRGDKDFQPLAVIPKSVQSRAIKEGWNDDDKAWKRWMNDIDNRYLRITTGNV
jgi:hypothetical protein